MTLDEMAAMPVAAVAAPNAHLYLWTINHYLPDAFDLMRAWGFAYSTTLVWAKAPLGGGGLGGTYRISTEFCLFGRRGTLRAKDRVAGTWFNWKRSGRHSTKPPEFLEMVERISPGPYLELFARTRRPGWAAWGNEITGGYAAA